MSDVSLLILFLFELSEGLIIEHLSPPDGLMLAEHLDLAVESARKVTEQIELSSLLHLESKNLEACLSFTAASSPRVVEMQG